MAVISWKCFLKLIQYPYVLQILKSEAILITIFLWRFFFLIYFCSLKISFDSNNLKVTVISVLEGSNFNYLCTWYFAFAISNASVQFSRSVVSDSLWPHELPHARPPCPSQTPGVHPNQCPLSQWCHPTISSSVIHFSFCRQSFPASGSFESALVIMIKYFYHNSKKGIM